MGRRKRYQRTAAGVLAVTAAIPSIAQAWDFHFDHVLGTSLDVVAVTGEQGSAVFAVNAVLEEVARLEAVLSSWVPSSEVNALNRAASRHVSDDLLAVLRRGNHWKERSRGAFDPAIGALCAAWSAGAACGAVPKAIVEQSRHQSAESVRIIESHRSVIRPASIELALDGIAKSYIVDAAIERARTTVPDLQGMLVNIGGDLRCWGDSASARSWRIGVWNPYRPHDNDAPALAVCLRDQAIATSGRGYRDITIGTSSFSHTISPNTGWPADHVLSATVIAPLAQDADALATAFSVMDPQRGLRLADELPGVEAMITTSEGKRYFSAGWGPLMAVRDEPHLASDPIVLAQASTLAQWPSGYELTVRYEIPKVRAMRYYRPYVVAWITDSRRQVVKHLLMLGRRFTYHESNYVWLRQRGSQAGLETVQTVSRPTRMPGRYTVTWDGRDDQGNAVARGRYTLHIEAARENGGHSHQTLELDLGIKPLEENLKGRGEIGDAQIRYGRPMNRTTP